ncbi:MAG TPA: hypothetical protein VEJ41_10495, partial [Candidatus Acidoferrales bacterium]|nr:hypothetical protein [Candidatus Acidoferrales bacterium]
MTNSTFRRSVEEARWIESSILKSRLLSIGVAAVVFAVLPWQYSRWLQISILVIWLVQGVAVATVVSRATRADQIRVAGATLLILDTLVLIVPVVLYLPSLPEVWIALLVPLIWGGVRERILGAAAVALLGTLVLTAALYFHWMAPAGEPQTGRFIFDVGILWLCVLAVSHFVRGVSFRSETLASQQEKLESALRSQEELRAHADVQASTLKKVTELAVSLLRERQLNALMDRMLDVTIQSFGFQAGAILIAERESETYVYTAMRGYPKRGEQELSGRRVPFALLDLKTDKRFAIRPSVYYAPVERQTWYTDPARCHDPEAVNTRRAGPGAWHEADTLIFALRSSSGEVIGLLVPDAPADKKVPSDETIDNIALFARLAAAAIENVHIVTTEKSRANTLSEQNLEMKRLYSNVEALAEERRLQADRLARILELSAAIFR